eukprot:TRINITY_DN12228_c0_g1_i1.p1 TRINITY_DN12228_c0_g1~~TRINITY_DN12228_c0_g1_i1.p1  ORF type:complete len:1218 (-),score=268.97 TRINITY_DN12228_c0_g1_i1:495-4148(-)
MADPLNSFTEELDSEILSIIGERHRENPQPPPGFTPSPATATAQAQNGLPQQHQHHNQHHHQQQGGGGGPGNGKAVGAGSGAVGMGELKPSAADPPVYSYRFPASYDDAHSKVPGSMLDTWSSTSTQGQTWDMQDFPYDPRTRNDPIYRTTSFQPTSSDLVDKVLSQVMSPLSKWADSEMDRLEKMEMDDHPSLGGPGSYNLEDAYSPFDSAPPPDPRPPPSFFHDAKPPKTFAVSRPPNTSRYFPSPPSPVQDSKPRTPSPSSSPKSFPPNGTRNYGAEGAEHTPLHQSLFADSPSTIFINALSQPPLLNPARPIARRPHNGGDDFSPFNSPPNPFSTGTFAPVTPGQAAINSAFPPNTSTSHRPSSSVERERERESQQRHQSDYNRQGGYAFYPPSHGQGNQPTSMPTRPLSHSSSTPVFHKANSTQLSLESRPFSSPTLRRNNGPNEMGHAPNHPRGAGAGGASYNVQPSAHSAPFYPRNTYHQPGLMNNMGNGHGHHKGGTGGNPRMAAPAYNRRGGGQNSSLNPHSTYFVPGQGHFEHPQPNMNHSPPTSKERGQQSLRSQLQLSPTTKQAYKDFFKGYKLKEKAGFKAAKLFASQHFPSLPPKVHWKVYLEIADLAKRENKFNQARHYYRIVNRIQPYAAKGWLEYSKMEEESGHLAECSQILADGLHFCPHNENLLVKGIKHCEKMGSISQARVLLSRLKEVAMERSWRTIMEGGLLEARQGNVVVARQIFKYLMENVPSYGPIYTEAVKLEMRLEEFERALVIVEKGLSRISSYGPLWFLALSLEELIGLDYRARVANALPNLSQELVWKLFFELAQIEERKKYPKECRKAYVNAVLACNSPSLLWKIWLGGARTEIKSNNIAAARRLLLRAHSVVPPKMRATVLIECARFEEITGNIDGARHVLRKGKREANQEWKICLELVQLEMRASQFKVALQEVHTALEVHTSTGRLWAMLIQLSHLVNISPQYKYDLTEQSQVFMEALSHVPKSGEVWCEGARLSLHQKLLPQALKFLEFATQFTPQYGDSFIELLRYQLLLLLEDDRLSQESDFDESVNVDDRLSEWEKRLRTIGAPSYEAIEKKCINAEPTYGICWSYCRVGPTCSSKKIMRNAWKKLITLAVVSKRAQLLSSSSESPEGGPESSAPLAGKSSPDPTSTSSKPGEDASASAEDVPSLASPGAVVDTLDLVSSFIGKGPSIFKLEPFNAIFL